MRAIALKLARRGLGALALAALAFGCATPQPSHRLGLFDRLAAERANRSHGRHVTAQDLAGPSRAPAEEVKCDPSESPSNSNDAKSDQARASQSKAAQADSQAELAKPIRVSLRWPLKQVHVTSPFGQRGSEFHEGVDLRAKTGTAVYAAHSGVVLYAGNRIRGYGKMIVLKNSAGVSTVYAHNSRLLVHAGQWVHQGREIALSGKTGRATAPHLHFEIRRGITAVDPTQYLPGAKYAQVESLSRALARTEKSHYSQRIAQRGKHRSAPAAVAVSGDESPSAAE